MQNITALYAQQLDSTNLPLIIIETNNQTIVNEPKITVDMKIIDRGNGLMNHPWDAPNIYNGKAGIEIRGAYSSTLPQKPYGIETRDSAGGVRNISLLGMPAENDWILLANYNDKTFMRNILANELFRKMGHYAPRTRLCEVLINGEYKGIYVFTEKIKRDSGRVAIAKLDSNENYGTALTGGYIFKVGYWNGSNSWLSAYNNPNYPSSGVHYVYYYPDEWNITYQQKNYLQNWVGQFEDALWGNNFCDSMWGYRPYIDVLSFIDYFIVNEFARNVDGYKKSRYLYKDRDDREPHIHAGPVWDFDWAFKDTNYGMLNGSGWRYNYSGASDVKPPGWYIRMMQDTTFANELNCRYFELRKTVLDTNWLFAFIDSIANLVQDAQVRHYIRWPILGINVGTPEIGPQPTTYAGEIVKFKGWISERLAWLDANMPGNCPNTGVIRHKRPSAFVFARPNPSFDMLTVYSNIPIIYISVYTLGGKKVWSQQLPYATKAVLPAKRLHGFYVVELQLRDRTIRRLKIVSY